MLAAGTLAQAGFSAIGVGLPSIGPELREHFGLSLAQVGFVFSAVWIGTFLTLLPWGLLADRIGERVVLGVGLGACGLLLIAAGFVDGYAALIAVLVVAGGFGAATASSSGRAVMQWFGPEERGLALGVRQSAIPIGGIAAAFALPAAGSVRVAFALLGGFCLFGALLGALFVRDRGGAVGAVREEDVPWTLRDVHLWRLTLGSSLYVFAQVAVISFVVLFLHDERGWSNGEAAAVLAAVHVGAIGTRIAAGRWSDALGARLPPLRRIGVASCAGVALVTALLGAPVELLVPVFVAAGATTMAWNGLAFHAAAELGGARRSGAAIGFQQSVLNAFGLLAPAGFAAAVSAGSWRAAYAAAAVFPLLGAMLLRPLRG